MQGRQDEMNERNESRQDLRRSSKDYVHQLSAGDIIAFFSGRKVLSAKVLSVLVSASCDYEKEGNTDIQYDVTAKVETAYGRQFTVTAENILWVKVAGKGRFPKRIYNLMKANEVHAEKYRERKASETKNETV